MIILASIQLHHTDFYCISLLSVIFSVILSVLQELTPKYEKLAQIFSGDKNILIGKVDATQHESLAQR